MSYEDNYDQTARWDAESVREAEQRTQHRSTRSSAERQKLKKKGQQPEHHRHEAPRRGTH